jgi:hypothetical protein
MLQTVCALRYQPAGLWEERKGGALCGLLKFRPSKTQGFDGSLLSMDKDGFPHTSGLYSLEICASGSQALGLEQAGFLHTDLVEIDSHSCATLRLKRPEWNVIESDLREFDGTPLPGHHRSAGWRSPLSAVLCGG